MSRKFLDSLQNIERWDVSPKSKTLDALYANERKTYGFDSRECYHMDLSFVSWLYERVSMYRAITKDRDDIHQVKLHYDGRVYSQAALMDTLLESCKRCLLNVKDKRYSQSYYKELDECIRIWAILLPTMWIE